MQAQGERRPSQRLPVNPRRHKVAPEQRKRVARACNSCNVRRIKCSGDRPCTSCASANRECIYPEPVEKITVPKNELDELKKKMEMYEKALQVALPDPAKRHRLLHDAASSPSSTNTTLPVHCRLPASTTPLLSASTQTVTVKAETLDDNHDTARLLHDSDGTARFHGETSGATFLDHLKELISAVLPLAHHQKPSTQDGSAFLSTVGKCYTDDSRPLNEKNVDPFYLPEPQNMASMLSEARYVILDGNGEWPSGGIYWFGDLIQPRPLPLPLQSHSSFDLDVHRPLAFTQVVFAVAAFSTAAWPPIDEQRDVEFSDSFFARASTLLRNPLDIGRCAIYDVSTLALMAFHLIEVYKRDSAYMHVATAAHLCIMLGVHRGWVDEKGKRIFWTVYILDRWLSCLMGRPPVIADDCIRIPLPSDAPNMPPSAGIRAHVELSRISGYVVCNMYWIAPRDSPTNPGDSFHSPEKTLCMLADWKKSLPLCLQLSSDGLSQDPACIMLHMRYNQLIIVATRPLFFNAVKKFVAGRRMPPGMAKEYKIHLSHLTKCIDAARHNMKLGRHFTAINRHRKPLHALQHYTFSAAVCLILESLVHQHHSDSAEDIASRNNDIQFALSMHEPSERLKSDPNDKSCVETLQELRMLVARLVAPPAPAHVDSQMGINNAPSLPLANLVDAQQVPRVSTESEPILYNELANWIDSDWFMCSNYMT